EMDRHMEHLMKKYLKVPETEQYKTPEHVDLCLTAGVTKEEFLGTIEKALGITNENYTFGIIGLHPVRPIPNYGYPLSKYLKDMTFDVRLSYEAREISCHAIELYNERLSLKDYGYLKVHSFRAAAERIIVKHYSYLKHSGLKSVKHSPDMKFEDYFYKAVKGLPVESLTSEELNCSVTKKDLSNWQQIVIFYTLRLFFAPLIESVLLYDRMLYLYENG
ncbi:hypothetical protein DOY81_013247, partial [Sarcophaga bullata]